MIEWKNRKDGCHACGKICALQKKTITRIFDVLGYESRLVREEWVFIGSECAEGVTLQIGERFGSEDDRWEVLFVPDRRHDALLEWLTGWPMTDQGECSAAHVAGEIIRAGMQNGKLDRNCAFIAACIAAKEAKAAFVDDLTEKMKLLDRISGNENFSSGLKRIVVDALETIFGNRK